MAVNSLGSYYNKYMDNNFDLPHIDYRKDNTLTDNNMTTIYGKKIHHLLILNLLVNTNIKIILVMIKIIMVILGM